MEYRASLIFKVSSRGWLYFLSRFFLGMGWIYAATKLPIIGAIVDTLYGIWADWRLTLTARPDLATIVAERQKRIECKTQGRCQIK